MENRHEDNKRIARNTVFLYMRMFVTLAVTLYTSRVVLDVLGVEDFGIYSLVAGVVVLFSFLNAAITNALQRYITMALGKRDKAWETRIFSTSFMAMTLLALVLLMLCETVGLWFLNTKLDIPSDRMTIANVVYQISIAIMIADIFRAPYNALIIAYERMNFYAYISIAEAVLKLVIVFMLYIVAINKLLLYALLLLGVGLVILLFYALFCRRTIPVRASRRMCDRSTLKELTSFSGWNVLGGVADIGYQQGTNMILNIFYGVTLNATMGVTIQVKNAVYNFARNLLTAANPQIIKSYARGEYTYMQTLVTQITKYAFFLLYLTSFPLILNMDFVLHVWLKNPPAYSVQFCNLMLAFCMLDSFVGPLWTLAMAHGKIKGYQIVSSLILLLNFPLSWTALKLGAAPQAILIVQICVAMPNLIYRVMYLRNRGILRVKSYLAGLIPPIICVGLVTAPPLLFLSLQFTGWTRLLVTTGASFIVIPSAVLFLGMKAAERATVISKVRNKLHLAG